MPTERKDGHRAFREPAVPGQGPSTPLTGHTCGGPAATPQGHRARAGRRPRLWAGKWAVLVP